MCMRANALKFTCVYVSPKMFHWFEVYMRVDDMPMSLIFQCIVNILMHLWVIMAIIALYVIWTTHQMISCMIELDDRFSAPVIAAFVSINFFPGMWVYFHGNLVLFHYIVIMRIACSGGILSGCNFPINTYIAIKMGACFGTCTTWNVLLFGFTVRIFIVSNRCRFFHGILWKIQMEIAVS